MASSLHELLTQEIFRRRTAHHRPTSSDDHRCSPSPSDSPPTLSAGISLCRNRRSVDLFTKDASSRKKNAHHRHRRNLSNGSLSLFSKTTNSNSSGTNSRSRATTHDFLPDDDPLPAANDDVSSVRAVVSILSGHVGRYFKDRAFRTRLRQKCAACLEVTSDPAHPVFVNMQMGIDSVERLAEDSGGSDLKIRSLRNSVRHLASVASLGSPRTRHGYTCGVSNAHLSACAQLYLSLVYKAKRNDRIAVTHLLQAFCDAPYLARRNLLPELWDRFFLPHLLHLKVWYCKEVEALGALDDEEREQSVKGLNRVYNDRMNLGTAQFALYYKEWLNVGGKNPVVPNVSLPLRSSYHSQSGKRSVVPTTPCSVNRSIYGAVFNHRNERDLGGARMFDDEVQSASGKEVGIEEVNFTHGATIHTDKRSFHRRIPSHILENAIHGSTPTPRRSYSFRLFSCRSDTNISGISRSQMPKNEPATIAREPTASVPLLNLSRSVTLISSSDSLSECETAIRMIAKAWLDSQGDPAVEKALSTVSIIEGLLEISFTSKNDEVLELAISILAELVTRNEVNRQIVLNADPQLEIFLKLLASRSLFLKVTILLYLLRPKAKQMLSTDWVPLVLHVLGFGDHVQTLFSVECSPKSAAFYLLDQLLMGFDVDRNVENAKQVVALGGLSLLIQCLELGDICERRNAAYLLTVCVRADGTCREYLAANIKKASILELFLGNQLKSNGHALFLLVELLCLRRNQITKFLVEMKNEGCFNTMHILLVYLQQAPAEQRPLVAAILLQLDLLGDPLQYSIYREEAIDAIVRALDCTNSKKVQENCSRAFLILGGRFSSTGEASAETWLLKSAGLDDCPADPYYSKEMIADEFMKVDEEDSIEEWLGRLAGVLLTRGNKRFLIALSNCIVNAIPHLSRSSLVTIAWISNSLALLEDANELISLASSIFMPHLIDSIKYDRALEDRVLASLALFNFAKNSDHLSKILPLHRDTEGLLEDLSRFTWTAKEVIFLASIATTSVNRV